MSDYQIKVARKRELASKILYWESKLKQAQAHIEKYNLERYWLAEVSVEEVKHWLGSDCSFDDVCETLQELANGVYQQNQLLEDIKNTAESTGFYMELQK